MTNQELLEDFYNYVRKETGIETLTENEILEILWMTMTEREKQELIADWQKKLIDLIVKCIITKGGVDNGKTTDA